MMIHVRAGRDTWRPLRRVTWARHEAFISAISRHTEREYGVEFYIHLEPAELKRLARILNTLIPEGRRQYQIAYLNMLFEAVLNGTSGYRYRAQMVGNLTKPPRTWDRADLNLAIRAHWRVGRI